MKKVITVILSCVLFLCAFSCSKKEENKDNYKTAFSITIEEVTGGTLTCDKEKVNVGESATFTMTASGENVLESFVVNGGKIKVAESETQGEYVWTLQSVLSDITATATFVNPNGSVRFDADGGKCDVESKDVTLYDNYGTLPTPYCVGKRFIGWFDEQDNLVLASSKVTALGATLKAKWDVFSESEKEGLEPYSITATYYDKDATKYGVVWHTENKPIAPVIQIVEATNGASVDFSSAQNYACTYGEFISHYITTGLLDNLQFDTSYAVRVGDIAADEWSKTYYFTTRKEVVEQTNILFLADTQEMYNFDSPYNASDKLLDSEGNQLRETFYQNVLKEATTRFPETDFIAHAGDMINFGGSEVFVKEMLTSVQDYSFQYPTQVASGNHEYTDGGAGIENLSVLFHYDSASAKLEQGDLYSFDYGYVHFVVLRSNDIYNRDSGAYAEKLDNAQIQWLENDLGGVDKEKTPWVVCMMHESFVSLKAEEKMDYAAKTVKTALAKQLLPITTKYNVDVLLFGHEHVTISTNPIISGDGVNSTVYLGSKVQMTTTSMQKVLHDGVMVDEFDFAGVEATRRGTVYHQTASASGENEQMKSNATWSNRYGTGINFLRVGYSGGSGSFTDLFDGNTLIDEENSPAVKKGKHYSMYSYLEVTKNSFVLRTYGVDCRGLAAKTSGQANTDFGVYFEGFKLTK